MVRYCLLALVAAAATTAIPAVGRGAGQAVAQSAEGKELDRRICRTDRTIGSRVRSQRICMTKREWLRLHGATRNAVDRYTRENTAPNPSGN